MTDYDVIVVGAGVIGLSTGYHLTRKGCKCLILEQFPLFHSRGSSCGHSRLSKISHLKDFVSDLSANAYRTWQELEKQTGIQFIVNDGHLIICHDSIKEKIEILKEVLTKANFDYQIYRGHEIGKRFPGLNFDESFTALYEPNGMVLKADKCLRALKKEILRNGGIIQDEEKVNKVTPINENKVLVHTSKGIYSAKSVVLACGPWINEVLKCLNTSTTAQVARVVAYFWKETKPEIYSVSNKFPPLMVLFKEYHVYSTPSMEYPGLIKICYHHRSPVHPDRPSIVSAKDEIREKNRLKLLKSMISDHFSYLEENPVVQETYLQTVTPSSTPILDRHPHFTNIIVGGGFSGYGFGLGPEFGKILSDFAISKTYQTTSNKLCFHNFNSKL